MKVCDPRIRVVARAIGYPGEWYFLHWAGRSAHLGWAEQRAEDRYAVIEAAVRVLIEFDAEKERLPMFIVKGGTPQGAFIPEVKEVPDEGV